MSGKTWVAIGSDNAELVKKVFELVSTHPNNQGTVVKMFGEVEIDFDLTPAEKKLAADRLLLARALLAGAQGDPVSMTAIDAANAIVESVNVTRATGVAR